MNTKKILVVTVFVLMMSIKLNAQSSFQFGGLPSFNMNTKLKNDWSFNTKIESRQSLQRGVFGGEIDRSYQYLLTDFSVIAAKKVGLNARLGGGYLLRFEGEDLFHRFIQQYSFVRRMIGYRLAHRFLSDQTISQAEETTFRLRYRLVSEIPLSGESADPKEFYLKIGNEYINSLQAAEYDLEVRFTPMIGYGLSKTFRVETGLDYRVNSFLENNAKHSFWLSLNFYMEM